MYIYFFLFKLGKLQGNKSIGRRRIPLGIYGIKRLDTVNITRRKKKERQNVCFPGERKKRHASGSGIFLCEYKRRTEDISRCSRAQKCTQGVEGGKKKNKRKLASNKNNFTSLCIAPNIQIIYHFFYIIFVN